MINPNGISLTEYNPNITIGRINDFEKWLAQNKAECIDCIEGSLIDNSVYECKNGIAFIYERYLNCWSSYYELNFIRYKKENKPLIDQYWEQWEQWEQFRQQVEQEDE